MTTPAQIPNRPSVPPLKCKIEVLHTVSDRDLDTFIRQATGRSYESVAYEEWGNGESHEFSADGKDVDEERIAALLAGKPKHYSLGDILNYLVREQYLVAGKYLVKVSW